MVCGVFRKKKNTGVVLFDGGLRIESPGRVLYKNRWKNRYIVCQRRNGSEAPLIGLFKNDKTREKGQHLELFYMQNYIGYEYGFRVAATTKTLALLMQDRTLVLSFYNGECMIFWKEWLRDICGRSLIFCMRVNNLPRTAILQLIDNDVRIHLTKTLLVVVQSSPPTQLICLNLRSLTKVECSDGELSFDANARSWLKLHTFSFIGEHTAQISRALRLLLRPEQFLNPIPSDSINTNNSILHHPQGLRERHLLQQQNEFVSMPHLHLHQRSQMTTPAQTLPLPPRKPWHDQTTMASHHYVNTKNISAFTTMPSETFDDRNTTAQDFHERQQYHNLQLQILNSSNGGDKTPIPPPLYHPSRKPTVHSTDFTDNASLGSRDSSSKLDDLTHQNEFIDDVNGEPQASGTAFLNLPPTSNTLKGAEITGLVKIEPGPKTSVFDKHSVGPRLYRNLFDKLSGSFEQYDGDRQTRGYTDSESFGGALNSMPIIDSSRIATSLDGNFNFNMSSSSRIDIAIQKQREYMKQRERSENQMYAVRPNIGGSGDSSSSSAYQAFPSPAFARTVAYSENSNDSMRTVQANPSKDDQTSCGTMIYQQLPEVVSNVTLQTPAAEEAELETPQRGLSTVSLPVNFHIQQPSFPPIQQSADDYSGSLASVQSELNEHIIRGGRSRSSGRSTKAKKPAPSSLNYVAIDYSSMQRLDNYRQS